MPITIPTGSIGVTYINGVVFLDPSGTVLTDVPTSGGFPEIQYGTDILPSGQFNTTSKILDTSFAVEDAGQPIAWGDQVSAWFGPLITGGTNIQTTLKKFNTSAVIVDSWDVNTDYITTLDGLHNDYQILSGAVEPTGTYFYHIGRDRNGQTRTIGDHQACLDNDPAGQFRIHVYNLVSRSREVNLYGESAPYLCPFQVLVLPSGDIASLWANTNTGACRYRQIRPDGTLLHDWPLLDITTIGSTLLVRNQSDSSALWVSYYSDSGSIPKISQLSVTSGVLSSSFSIGPYVSGFAPYPFFVTTAEISISTGEVYPSCIYKADADGVGNDGGELFQGFITSRAVAPSGKVNQLGAIRESYITAKSSLANLQMTSIRDFGKATKTSLVSLIPELSETHVTRKFEDMQEADINYLQVQVGDDQPRDSQWAIDHLYVQVQPEGES